MTSGGRNLAILGVASILIAGATTTASLAIYRLSGDIYLDRSRPGYLPDEDETSDDSEESNFVFSENGNIDRAELDQYLKELKKVNDHIEKFSDPYAPGPLSDESLGISDSE